MKQVVSALGFLTFFPSSFADTNQNDTYQCMVTLKGRGATLQSKFIFDGNPAGTSFTYIQTYNISVYKYFDADSQIERIHLGVKGSLTGTGYVEYPIGTSIDTSHMSWTLYMPELFGNVQITCEMMND